MIKLEFTGDQESIDILTRLGLRPGVRWSHERAIITVSVQPGMMSDVSEALWTSVVQSTPYVMTKDLKIGDMVEFPDDFIGEIDYIGLMDGMIEFSAIGTGIYRYNPEDRVWVHSNA